MIKTHSTASGFCYAKNRIFFAIYLKSCLTYTHTHIKTYYLTITYTHTHIKTYYLTITYTHTHIKPNRQNYRGISLIPIVTKVFNKMQHNRTKPRFEKDFRMNQNGFREGWSTIGQILALRRIIEEAQLNQQS